MYLEKGVWLKVETSNKMFNLYQREEIPDTNYFGYTFRY